MDFKKFSEENNKVFDSEFELFLKKEINAVSQKKLSGFYAMIKEYAVSGGKRLRPTAVILSYLATGGKDRRKILLPAIAVELHHTYSLILDDIMDEDELRRSKPTIYKMLKTFFLNSFPDREYNGSLFTKDSSRFAVSFAIMLGNITNILSKKALLELEFSDELKIKAIRMIEEADQEIYHGQMMDILSEHAQSDEASYLEMIRLKTAVLFSMSFKIGALFSGCDENKIEQFSHFGKVSALGFQIQDDLLDILGNKGHELGSDIKKGKNNLLVIKMLEKANDTQKKEFLKIFNNKNADESSVKKAISIMQDTKAIAYCKSLSDAYLKQSRENLRKINLDMQYNEFFNGMLEFMLNRTY